MRQPPESSPQGRAASRRRSRGPARMCAARAGAECAPISARRSVDLGDAMRVRRRVSASASSAARSVSAASTQSSRLSSPPGASCASGRCGHGAGSVIAPSSGDSRRRSASEASSCRRRCARRGRPCGRWECRRSPLQYRSALDTVGEIVDMQHQAQAIPGPLAAATVSERHVEACEGRSSSGQGRKLQRPTQ